MKKILIKKSEGRIDQYLSTIIPETRSQIQKQIKNGDVLINNKKCMASSKLQTGDIIMIEKTANKAKQVDSENRKIKKIPIKIINETDNFIVINKPAGIAVHGAEHMNEYSIVDWLIEKYPEIAKIGDDPLRPGIVHRLDKEVSGLMVIAKNSKTFNNLKKQFKDRTIIKKYIGLVYGTISRDSGEIIFPIKRSEKGYKMAAVPVSQTNEKTKTAVTKFETLKEYINYTLLNIYPRTGRTHQIRCHLSAISHPLVGDHLYGTKRTRLLNDKHKLGRIFLFACELSFTDESGETKEFKIKLPNDLKKFLDRVK